MAGLINMWHYSCYIGFPINVQKSQTVCLLIEGGQRELQLMVAQSSLMHLRSVAVVDVAPLVSLFISSWCGLTWNPRWGFPSSIFNEICPWPKISLASPAARPKMNPNCFALATHATFAFQKELFKNVHQKGKFDWQFFKVDDFPSLGFSVKIQIFLYQIFTFGRDCVFKKCNH